MIDITATDLDATGTVALRKMARELGIKGMSSAKGADLREAIRPIQADQLAAKKAEVKAKKSGKCIICGIRNGMSAAKRSEMGISKDFSDQCHPCYEEGGWENSHSDGGHATILSNNAAGITLTEEQRAEIDGCWICFPQLNLAKRPAREGRSRMGMQIVAQGNELHKSEVFKKAAEALGWKVTISTEDDGKEGQRLRAFATKGEETISLAWEGRAYSYPNSEAFLGGKARKVRNLKEALRLI